MLHRPRPWPSRRPTLPARRPVSVAELMRRTLLSLAVLLALGTPASALASKASDQIISECANEQLSQKYTDAQYQEALADLPADLREYTDCYDVIKAAQRGASLPGGAGTTTGGGTTGTGAAAGTVGGTTGTGGTAGPLPADPLASASPADQAAAKAAQAQGDEALQVGGATITPGNPGTLVSSLDDLPTPILVLLALVVVGGLAGLGYAIKRRVVGAQP